jgi:hypothetical protein
VSLHAPPPSIIVRTLHIDEPNVRTMAEMARTYGVDRRMYVCVCRAWVGHSLPLAKAIANDDRYFPAYVDERKVLHIVLRDAHEDALEECRAHMRRDASGAGAGDRHTHTPPYRPKTGAPFQLVVTRWCLA